MKRTLILAVLALSTATASAADEWYNESTFGIRFGQIPLRDKPLKKTSALYPTSGAWIASVSAKGAAENRGFKEGYVITKIGETAISTPTEALDLLKTIPEGQSTEFTYLRPGTLAGRRQWRDEANAVIKPHAFGEWALSLHHKQENPTREGWSQYNHLVEIDRTPLNGVTVEPFFNANETGEMNWNIQLGWKADDWLFIRSAEVKIGDTVIKRTFKLGDVKQNVRVGDGVEETVTVYLTDSEMKSLEKLQPDNGKVGIALNGKDSRASATISDLNYTVFRQTAAAALWHQAAAKLNKAK